MPSGSTVKVCSSPVAKLSARLIRIFPLVPRGLADAEVALTAMRATIAATASKKVVSRRISPLPVVKEPMPLPAATPGPRYSRAAPPPPSKQVALVCYEVTKNTR